MTTTTELTERYLGEHPSIKDCLKNGVINYSKLSRKIARELGIEKERSVEAILIACRRYAQKLKKEKVQEDAILNILKKSELEIKNKIVVAVIDKHAYTLSAQAFSKKVKENYYQIEGTSVFTLILPEKFGDDLQSVFKKCKLVKDLAMITIKSPPEIETTPGVIAYLYSLFGDHGINIVEQMSCWTDTIFVVDEEHVAAIMKFLKF